MLVLRLLLILTSPAIAAPSINLPINAQVPPVALVNHVYNFVFSESTFTSTDTSIDYTVSNCPSWLHLDGPSRTFYGTPGSSGVGTEGNGSFVVDLIATDGAGSTKMPVTFVVTTDPGPGLGTPIANQLSAFGAYSSPDTLLLTSGTALWLSFSPSTFTNTNAHTNYYALCANNTPLPSWVNFDPNSLTFSGTTPHATSPSELPQSFDIQLAASGVSGFAQAVTSFQLVIESHILAFGNSLQIVNATIGTLVNFAGLREDLTLDGQPVQPTDLVQIASNTPSWLSLNNSTLSLSGTPPTNAAQANFTVTADDRFGDTASTIVLIQIGGHSPSTLINPIAALSARIGTDFTFDLGGSLPLKKDANVIVDPGTASAWLKFNATSLELYGHVPSDLKQQTVHFNITVTREGQTQSQIVDVNVMCRNTGCPSPSPSSTAPDATAGVGVAPSTRRTRSKAWIAATIIPLAAIAGLLVVMYRYRRRGQEFCFQFRSQKMKKNMISLPIDGEKDGNYDTKGGFSWNEERSHERSSSEASGPPKIPWAQEPRLKRKSRFRLSKNTLESTERSPRPDSWQSYVRKLEPSRAKLSPAVSKFGFVPEEPQTQKEESTTDSTPASKSTNFLPRSTADPSLVRELSQHMRRVSNMNHGGFGVFPNRPPSGFGHGRIGPSQGSSSLSTVNRGVGHGGGGTPSGPPGWGIVRSSWRNLSSLSWTDTESSPNSDDPIVEPGTERPSTQRSFASMISAFPRPSTSNNTDVVTRPDVIHEASDDDNDDTRPSALPSAKSTLRKPARLKPGSSFRRRASTKSLQDFHKRRLQEKTHNPLFSAHLSSSRKSSMQMAQVPVGRQNDGDIMLGLVTPPKQTPSQRHTHSPSLERQASRESSPDQSPKSVSSPHRSKSRLHPQFTVRPIQSRSSDASTGSSKFSDPVDAAPFYPHGALFEDTDAEGNKRWRHPHHPNPLATNRTNPGSITDVSDAELIDSLRAAGQISAAQRLEYLRAQTEGRDDVPGVDAPIKVCSAKGRRLDQESGLKSGDSENRSIEGDIRDAGGSSAFV